MRKSAVILVGAEYLRWFVDDDNLDIAGALSEPVKL